MQGLQLRAKAGIARAIAARRPKLYAPDSWQANLTHFSTAMRLDECQIANALTDHWSRWVFRGGVATRSLGIAGRKTDHASDRVWKAWRATGY
jgi:hypothetical protein